MSKLVLGTVNFGMKYGPNQYQVPPDEIEKILTFAEQNDLTLDTAAAYGTAEQIIGQFGYKGKIATKIYPWSDEHALLTQIYDRLKILKQDKLFTVLIHSEQQIYDIKLLSKLLTAKSMGLVENIGISVYDPEIALIAAKMGFDAIQIPFNVFNCHQLQKTGFFDLVQQKNIALYARTAFLQGYLNNNPNDEKLKKWPNFSENYEELKEISNYYGFSPIEAALIFTYQFITYYDGSVVIGVDNLDQLKQNIETVTRPDDRHQTSALNFALWNAFTDTEYQIPSLWADRSR